MRTARFTIDTDKCSYNENLNRNTIFGIKISDVLYKHYTSLESVPDKFAKNKRAIYHPMNLKDFNRIYNV